MSREGDAAVASRSRGPDVPPPPPPSLQSPFPAARDEPAGHVVDDAPFGARRRLDRDQLGGERYDIGHGEEVALRVDGVRTRRAGVSAAPSAVRALRSLRRGG